MTAPSFDDLRWINLEPIGACNLRCPHCPRDDKARHQGRMDRDLFDHLLAQVPAGCEVRLFLSGEPFLDRDLGWRVKRCRETSREVLIHTNATVITRSRAVDVLCQGWPGLTISVSVDGLDAAEYERMRPPARFADLLSGLDALRHAQRVLYPYGTQFVLQTIVPHPHPLDRPNRDLGHLAGMFDHIYVRWPHNWAEMRSVEGAAPPAYAATCSFLSISMSVQNDGRVVPCCAMLNAERVIGDANEEPLRAIFDREVSRIREAQQRGEYVPICSTCERYGKGDPDHA